MTVPGMYDLPGDGKSIVKYPCVHLRDKASHTRVMDLPERLMAMLAASYLACSLHVVERT